MLASVLIIAISAVLLAYWFRYTCLLVLRSQNSSEAVACAGGLSCNEIGSKLAVAEAGDLDPLHRLLQRDYEVLTYLVRHAAGLTPSVEQRILVLDYRIMRAWYWIARTAAPTQARAALSEMAQILTFLSRDLGERAGSQSRA